MKTDQFTLKADITSMQMSDSNVAKTVAEFLLSLAKFKSLAQLDEEFKIANIQSLFLDGKGAKRIVAATSWSKVGKTAVVLTAERTYYLVYFPEPDSEVEAIALACAYQEYIVPFPECFSLISNVICLEIDVKQPRFAAVPIALLKDSSQPENGLITCQIFAPTLVSAYTELVSRAVLALNGDCIEIDGQIYFRPIKVDFPRY